MRLKEPELTTAPEVEEDLAHLEYVLAALKKLEQIFQ